MHFQATLCVHCMTVLYAAYIIHGRMFFEVCMSDDILLVRIWSKVGLKL